MPKSRHFSPKTPPVTPLPGSLHAEYVRCGKANCRCTRGELHGPYWRRFWRENGRTYRQYVHLAEVEQIRAAVLLWRVEHPSVRTLLGKLRELRRLIRLVEGKVT